jgi:hypothetical protein
VEIRCSLVLSTIGLGFGAALTATNAWAEDAKTTDTSQYTLFNPTPADKMRGFSTDRPPSPPSTGQPQRF